MTTRSRIRAYAPFLTPAPTSATTPRRPSPWTRPLTPADRPTNALRPEPKPANTNANPKETTR